MNKQTNKKTNKQTKNRATHNETPPTGQWDFCGARETEITMRQAHSIYLSGHSSGMESTTFLGGRREEGGREGGTG